MKCIGNFNSVRHLELFDNKVIIFQPLFLHRNTAYMKHRRTVKPRATKNLEEIVRNLQIKVNFKLRFCKYFNALFHTLYFASYILQLFDLVSFLKQVNNSDIACLLEYLCLT